MNQHQQTLRDIEALREPSPLKIAAYAAVTVAAISCALLFAFSL